MLKLTVTEQDDTQFVEFVTSILQGAVECYKPIRVYITQVDGWFDHKWKSFSGVIDLQLGVWSRPLLTVPPFNPHRVVSQYHFQIAGTGYQIAPIRPLHQQQASISNIHRRLKEIVDTASLLLWYSGATRVNDKASLMVYFIGQTDEIAWYASFNRHHEEWRVNKLKGISQQEFASIAKLSTIPFGL